MMFSMESLQITINAEQQTDDLHPDFARIDNVPP